MLLLLNGVGIYGVGDWHTFPCVDKKVRNVLATVSSIIALYQNTAMNIKNIIKK